MEVVSLKNLFVLAVLKMSRIPFVTTKKLEAKLSIYINNIKFYVSTLPSMYFRVNLKMKKPTLYCLTRIAFIELNFTVAFLLIRKI